MSNKKVTKLARKKKQSLNLKNSDIEGITNSEGLGRLREGKDIHGNPVVLPIEFSFKLAVLLDELQSPTKAYLEQKQRLINTYGDRDKENNLIQAKPGMYVFTEKGAIFQIEYNKLLNIDVPIFSEKLELKKGDIPNGILYTNDIFALRCIITFKD